MGSAPVLACRTCKNSVVPAITRRAAMAARAAGQKGLELRPSRQRFSLCNSARFEYCAEDREIIAGLGDGGGNAAGHYVPVFFSRDVLLRYTQRPEYAIESVGLHKRIVFQDGTRLGYGVNRHGKVFCWLGDLDAIPREEQELMREHNVESDHDVISSMYKEGRLGMNLGGVAEELLKGAIYELAEASSAHAGFAIHRLEYAERHLAEMMQRPRAWHRDTVRAVVNLDRLCVEAIDTRALKGSLEMHGDKAKEDVKGIKSLEAWAGANLEVDAGSTLGPFFALHDWRNYLVHRASDGGLLEKLKRARVRMGMEEDDDSQERMYDLLLEGITASCRLLASEIEVMRGRTVGRGGDAAPGAGQGSRCLPARDWEIAGTGNEHMGTAPREPP
ncbi:MAG: hypothetical protein OXU37_08745 [Thaumarchaeota archaeon]|nr:hypothetical protein [Nitrososphaerota archaeon]